MILLHTPRLILRTWEDSDIEPFSKMNQDAEVMKYFPSLLTPEESASRVDWQRRHFKEQGFCCYAVELKSTGEFIGFVGLAIPIFEAPFMPAVEIGWRIAKAHWNQGSATEAARYVLNHAFNDLNLTEVVSFTAVENQASRRVMEKIGMTHHPEDDFDHPRLPEGHPLRRHVLYRISAKTVQAQDSIEIENYDPNWPLQAQQEMTKLQPILSRFPIQHIGSTAVSGLSAKPIIDLAIGVNDLEAAKALIPQLIEQGYVFWEKNPDKSKLFLAKGMPPIGQKRTHHIHVMEITHHDWIVRPLFRDYLIANPEEQEAYQALKQALAKAFKEDREAYTSAKTAFIQNINQKAVRPYLNFEALSKSHFSLLLKWFNEPHVQEFYSLRPWTLSEIAEKFQDRVSEAKAISNIHSFIAKIQDSPVAYLQCYAVKDHPWEGQNFSKDFIEKSVGLDFFIGEPSFLGKKMSGLILESFIPEILKIYPAAKCLVVDPEIQNQRSIRFFEKQGFKFDQEISGKNALGRQKTYQLMVRKTGHFNG
jgi:RimJ/RimL family protein N-acetyltransferase